MQHEVDLNAAFAFYNDEHWGGDLPIVPVTRANLVGTGAVGEFWPDTRRIVVCESLDIEAALGCLVHEMIHLYQSSRGLIVDHGKEFKAWQKYLHTSTGLAI